MRSASTPGGRCSCIKECQGRREGQISGVSPTQGGAGKQTEADGPRVLGHGWALAESWKRFAPNLGSGFLLGLVAERENGSGSGLGRGVEVVEGEAEAQGKRHMSRAGKDGGKFS